MLCGYYIHPVWITSSILTLLTFLKLSFCLCEPQLNQGLNGYLLESKILLLQTMVLKCCLYLLTICIIKCSMWKKCCEIEHWENCFFTLKFLCMVTQCFFFCCRTILRVNLQCYWVITYRSFLDQLQMRLQQRKGTNEQIVAMHQA